MNKSNEHMDKKRSGAKARQEAYDKLSDKAKLDLLDDLLGNGKGAKRQRKRLQAKIKAETPVKE